MKKRLVFVISLIFLGAYFAQTASTSPPGSVTGAPGEPTCSQSNCHNVTINTGPAVLDFEINTAQYDPQTIYDITLIIKNSGKQRFGFEMTSLDPSNNMAGAFIKGPRNSSPAGVGGRRYIGHLNADADSSWSFQWKAPDFIVGDVTFYVAFNAANGNDENTGDNIYSTSAVLSPHVISGIDEEKSHFNIYPNPFIDKINISAHEADLTITIFSSTGKIVHQSKDDDRQIDLEELPMGIYFVVVEFQNRKELYKILKIR